MNSFKICGLDCANCARELEEEILKIDGVKSARVDFMALKVYADCPEATLAKIKEVCNNFEEVKVLEETSGGERIKISGLCCANCARELEEILNGIDGVNATVDFMNSAVVLSAEGDGAKSKAVAAIESFEDVKIVEETRKKKSVIRENLKSIILIAVSAILFIPAFILDLTGTAEKYEWVKILNYVLFSAAYISAGYPVLWTTLKNIAKGRIFDENFLMTIASLGAIALGIFAGDGFAEGVAVMLLYEIGELLQSIAVGTSRNSITALMDLKSESATLLENGIARTVSPDELKPGDIIMIKAGEKIPADCRILKGESSLDTKSLSGEPLPKDVKAGDEILSGSINLSGVIEAEVVREYKNSAAAKILELVENSTAKKSKSEKFITKFAKYYTPAVCIAAAVVAGLVPTIICAVRSAFVWQVYSEWIYKALGFLVISCPCALVISVPLSYFGGIGRCAKNGILVKGSTCLDELALATVAAFDKTGTITKGEFSVLSCSDDKTLSLAAAAEKFSSHPVAAAFKDIDSGVEIESAEEIAGRGVKCKSGGKEILCGNAKLLRENGIAFNEIESVSTVIYVSFGGEYVGVIEIGDSVKDGAAEAVKALKADGIKKTVMLTGDLKARAEAVCKQAGIDECRASLLPDEKLKAAEELKESGKLIYAGDGINDAPVMTVADCSVSMGKAGSDAAIEASDVVLVSDNLSLLPKGRKIAKKTRRIVTENIIGSLLVKAAIMALELSLAGFPLIISVIADVGVMIAAVANSLRA